MKKLLINQRYFQILGYALIIILLNPLTSAHSQNKNYSLLWEITGKNLKSPSYLFGTMHVDDNRAFKFSDEVMLSIEKSEAFALEVHPDTIIDAMFNDFKFNESKNVFKEYLTKKEYDSLKQKILKEKGVNIEEMNLSNPMFLKSFLTPEKDSEDDYATFVDAHLYGVAKTLGKRIYGLEKAEDQLNIFENTSEDKKRDEILGFLDFEEETYNELIDSLVTVYNRGSINEIETLINDFGGIDEVHIKRNYVMLNSILELIPKKSTFIAVGAAHLPGKEGLISLLKTKGYTVKPMSATFTGLAENYEVDPLKMQWFKFEKPSKGFNILFPGKPASVEVNEYFKMNLYIDIMTNIYYGLVAFELKEGITEEMQQELISNFGKNMIKSDDIIEERTFFKGNIKIYEISGKDEDNRINKVQLIVHNGLVYGLICSGKQKNIGSPYVKRFFESLHLYKPNVEGNKELLSNYIDETAGFTVNFSGTPKTMQKTAPNPLDVVGEPYKLNIIYHVNENQKSTQFVRFNDMPIKYYLNNYDDAIEGLKSQFNQKGTVTDIEHITIDGYPGAMYRLKIQDIYPALAKVIFRGNRTFMLMKQQTDSIVQPDDPFFDSFQLLPIKDAKTTYHKTRLGMKFKAFDSIHMTVDSTIVDTAERDTYNYYSRNPNSGGMYLYNEAEFKDLFHIKNLDSIYNDYEESALNWSDSIISSKNVEIKGHKGREYMIYNKQGKTYARSQFFCYKKYFIHKLAYDTKEQLTSNLANDYFNSFEENIPLPDYDLYASRTSLVLEKLKSSDTIVRNSAKEALVYNYYDKSDLDILHKALVYDYGDDDKFENAKSKIIFALSEIGDTSSLTYLENLYKNTSSIVKANILVNLSPYKTDESFNSYINLLSNNPPLHDDISYYSVIETLQDSIHAYPKYINSISKLYRNPSYRSSMLDLLNSYQLYENTDEAIAIKELEKLINYQEEILSNYLEIVKNDEEYTYDEDITNLLNVIENNSSTHQAIDIFTENILNLKQKGALWYKIRAITIRLEKGLKVKPETIESMLLPLYSRFETMEALSNNGQFNKIPSTYLKTKSFAELCLYNTIGLNDEYPNTFNYLGRIEDNNIYYYCYTFSYEDETQYLGIVQSENKNKSVTEIKKLTAYYTLKALDAKNWKNQAKELIPELLENGY